MFAGKVFALLKCHAQILAFLTRHELGSIIPSRAEIFKGQMAESIQIAHREQTRTSRLRHIFGAADAGLQFAELLMLDRHIIADIPDSPTVWAVRVAERFLHALNPA